MKKASEDKDSIQMDYWKLSQKNDMLIFQDFQAIANH